MSYVVQKAQTLSTPSEAAFDGVRISARSYAVASFFSPGISFYPSIEWSPQRHVDGAFVHRGFPDHVAWRDIWADSWVLVQRFDGVPEMPKLRAAAEALFGAVMVSDEDVIFPLRLRVPLDSTRAVAGGSGQGFVAGAPVFELAPLDVPSRIRLYAGTRGQRAAKFWAELLVGEFPPARSRIYVPDGRRLKALRGRRIQAYVAGALDDLVSVATYFCRAYGFVPLAAGSATAAGGRHFATLYDTKSGSGIVADFVVPGVAGLERFVTTGAPHQTVPIQSDSDRDAALTKLRNGGV